MQKKAPTMASTKKYVKRHENKHIQPVYVNITEIEGKKQWLYCQLMSCQLHMVLRWHWIELKRIQKTTTVTTTKNNNKQVTIECNVCLSEI